MLSYTQVATLRALLTLYAEQELRVAENNALPGIVDAAYQRRDSALRILEDLA